MGSLASRTAARPSREAAPHPRRRSRPSSTRLARTSLAVEDVFHAAQHAHRPRPRSRPRCRPPRGAQAGLPVHEYPPATVKQQVTRLRPRREDAGRLHGHPARSRSPADAAPRATRPTPSPSPSAAPACGPAGGGAVVIAHVSRAASFARSPRRSFVDVGGVGYRVHHPAQHLLPARRARRRGRPLLIHTHVREDALALFGFLTEAELALFERLIAVSGVGPKLALAILSGIEAPDLVAALRDSRRRAPHPHPRRRARRPPSGSSSSSEDKMQSLAAPRSRARRRPRRRRAKDGPRLRPRPPRLLARPRPSAASTGP